MEIEFGINFQPKGKYQNYIINEVCHFIEIANDSIDPPELGKDYQKFLKEWLSRKIKKNTLVNIELLKLLKDDLDNRAHIDFVEGHHDDDPEICAGGEYFLKVSKQLQAHIQKNT